MFSIVIPLYNEEKNIVNLLNEIDNLSDLYKNFEIILVDDCSNDNTLKVISSIEDNKIKILRNTKNYGQSYSIDKGVSNSFNKIIVTLDGDGQNDPSDIPKLMDFYLSNNEIKLIGGIRKKRKDSFIKIVSSRLANFIRSRILNDDCVDTGCSLKIFDKEVFMSLAYFDGIHRFLPALFKGYGYKTSFINVNHRERKYGISKYGTINRLIRGIRDMIKVRNAIKKRNK
tara:strand:+ start:72 stop:755 length:684 start_codon:yes stop_codon:yes gene_type:complete